MKLPAGWRQKAPYGALTGCEANYKALSVAAEQPRMAAEWYPAGITQFSRIVFLELHFSLASFVSNYNTC